MNILGYLINQLRVHSIELMLFLDAKRPVISGIDCAGILKDLSREVKNAERISLKVKKETSSRASL